MHLWCSATTTSPKKEAWQKAWSWYRRLCCTKLLNWSRVFFSCHWKYVGENAALIWHTRAFLKTSTEQTDEGTKAVDNKEVMNQNSSTTYRYKLQFSKYHTSNSDQKMARWRLSNGFPDVPILPDFLMVNYFEIPISLSKQYLKMSKSTNETFFSIFKLYATSVMYFLTRQTLLSKSLQAEWLYPMGSGLRTWLQGPMSPYGSSKGKNDWESLEEAFRASLHLLSIIFF